MQKKFIYGKSDPGSSGCHGADFISYKKTRAYFNSLLYATIRVKIAKEEGILDLETNMLSLPDGQKVPYDSGSSHSEASGQKFWQVTDIDLCHDHTFQTVYPGEAIVITENNINNTPVKTYYVNDNKTQQSFMINQKSEIKLCGIKTITTAASDIFIIIIKIIIGIVSITINTIPILYTYGKAWRLTMTFFDSTTNIMINAGNNRQNCN
jgi:hypothetical protein